MQPQPLSRKSWNEPGTRLKTTVAIWHFPKRTHALFEDIDKAMDQFVTLLMDHPTSAADPARVKTAYGAYLEKLKQAD